MPTQSEIIAAMESEMAATKKWFVGWLHVPGFIIGAAVGSAPWTIPMLYHLVF